MPRVEPWPFTIHIAGFETDCECFWRNHGVRTWPWGVFVIVLEAWVVWEVVALGQYASGIELLQLCRLGFYCFADVGVERYLDESAESEAEW